MTMKKRGIRWHTWVGFVATVVVLMVVLTGGPSAAAEKSTTTSEAVALEATSWLLTVPYGAVKVAYALGGGIVGGLAWVVTGGSTEVAESIWIPSITGDYIVRPENLTGEKPLHFVGKGHAS
jgi:hypothetical protein